MTGGSASGRKSSAANTAARPGYRAAQAARLVAFLTVFLPLVGVPALLGSLALQVWEFAALPFRIVRRLSSRTPASPG